MDKSYLNKAEKEQLWKVAAFTTTLEEIIEGIEASGADRQQLLKWLRSSKTFAQKALDEYAEGLPAKKIEEYISQYEDKSFYIK